ncbi:MAG TPA: aminotransferase class V-fold PLP-dependent enzyme [Rubricoccaceae bacterium]|nr:aminotransferase class V-fold PLP-dependent enzyme [Rubricoccaceae bacterium]
MPPLDLAALRAQTIGVDTPVVTPFGERLLVYADFTASGRCLAFVEDYLREVAALYANSHTEDSLTGRATTHLLHEAESAIKEALNAGEGGKVIACGTGSTAAIHKLQEILGVAIPPATRHFLRATLGDDAFAAVRAAQPVVFVGPYEHHSNEVTWREGLCEVVEVDLTPEGALDLAHLDRLLQDPAYEGRRKIGSFSAASNVTGLKSPVHEIARLLHRHGALALFDYAAAAPYVPIDMNPAGDPEAALDAVFLSPHKFLGGPGAAGVLVFHERLYDPTLPPSVGGGGTVDYVSPRGHDFTADIEAREKAGTPGVFQILRAALALELKRALGLDALQAREHALLARAFARWCGDERIEILGPADPTQRIGIVSFNLRDGHGGRLHPKLVAVLLNDLFGIQSRAGCSCAGPYGHRLLGIGGELSDRYRNAIREGAHGVKPGWCRVGFHYAMDDAEADYIVEAVSFLAAHGSRFLPLYRFRLASGKWTHRDGPPALPAFSLAAARAAAPSAPAPLPEAERRRRYAEALDEARRLADALPEPACDARLDGALGDLQFFALAGDTLDETHADDALCGSP